MNWTLRPVISICDFGYIEFFVKRKQATIFAYRDKWSCEELATIDALSIEEAQLKAEVVISDYLLKNKSDDDYSTKNIECDLYSSWLEFRGVK